MIAKKEISHAHKILKQYHWNIGYDTYGNNKYQDGHHKFLIKCQQKWKHCLLLRSSKSLKTVTENGMVWQMDQLEMVKKKNIRSYPLIIFKWIKTKIQT